MEPRPVRVLGIGGSMREGSMSLVLLKCALNLAASAGAETSLADVRALNLPMYNSDVPLDAHPMYEDETATQEGNNLRPCIRSSRRYVRRTRC